jgi:MarR family 2-MHQ and catechol resistance regulon transcriptional repressor
MGTRYSGSQLEKRALNAFIALMRASSSVNALVGSHLQKEELSGSQFGILEALYHLGPMPQQQLAKKLLVSKGNITFVLDNLEERELVKRVRSSVDRRVYEVHLTRSGKTLIARVFPKHATEIVEKFSVLSAEEQKQLRQICKKLGTQASID